MRNTQRRHEFVKSFEAKSLRSRSLLTQVSDKLTAICGSTPFLVTHIIWFTIWIGINTGQFAIIESFDPYPFGFLTMVVSLEAIFLAIFILVSQNRSSYVDTIREEVHLQVNMIAEEEITKVLAILSEMRQKMGITEPDPELEKMLRRIDTNYIEKSIASQLAKANKPLTEQLVKEFPDLIGSAAKKPFEMVQILAKDVEEPIEKEIEKEARKL